MGSRTLVQGRIIELLAQQGLSQADLAKKIGEHRNWVNNRLKPANPTAIKTEDAVRMAKALGVSPSELLDRREGEPIDPMLESLARRSADLAVAPISARLLEAVRSTNDAVLRLEREWRTRSEQSETVKERKAGTGSSAAPKGRSESEATDSKTETSLVSASMLKSIRTAVHEEVRAAVREELESRQKPPIQLPRIADRAFPYDLTPEFGSDQEAELGAIAYAKEMIRAFAKASPSQRERIQAILEEGA